MSALPVKTQYIRYRYIHSVLFYYILDFKSFNAACHGKNYDSHGKYFMQQKCPKYLRLSGEGEAGKITNDKQNTVKISESRCGHLHVFMTLHCTAASQPSFFYY